jgi:hypothetical protein
MFQFPHESIKMKISTHFKILLFFCFTILIEANTNAQISFKNLTELVKYDSVEDIIKMTKKIPNWEISETSSVGCTKE